MSNYCKECYKKQEQIEQLQAENERLKEELRTEKIHSSQIEELEESLQHAKAENERLKDANFILRERTINYSEYKEKQYKQALQEIRELIKKLDLSLGCAYGDYDCDNCSNINEETVCEIKLQNIILAKINEVIGAE